MLAEKTDTKTADNYVQQWKYAKNYLDRKEALDYFASNKMAELAEGLNDKFAGLREFSLTSLQQNKNLLTPDVIAKIETIANNDPSKKVLATAIEILADQADKKYISLFTKYVNDSSYSVSGNALEALFRVDRNQAFAEAKRLSSGVLRGKLAEAAGSILVVNGDEAGTEILTNNFKKLSFGQDKINALQSLAFALSKTASTENFRNGVNTLVQFKKELPASYKDRLGPAVTDVLQGIQKAKQAAGKKDEADYINQMIK